MVKKNATYSKRDTASTLMLTYVYENLCIKVSRQFNRSGRVWAGKKKKIIKNCISGFIRSQEGSDTSDHFPINMWWEEMHLYKTEFCLNEHSTTITEDFKASITSWIKPINVGIEGQLKPKHRLCNYWWGLTVQLQYI